MFDSRLTPARPDLAAAELRGQVKADCFVEGAAQAITAPSAPLRRRPDAHAPLDTEALFGETARVFERGESWCWAQLDRDGYVGYLPSAALGAVEPATHRVAAVRTHAYPERNIKTPPLFAVSLGAEIAVASVDGDFAIDRSGRWYWTRHLTVIGQSETDFVTVAERFLNCPYLWGGRTSEGIDCSGLTQTALRAAGFAAPRDSDMLASLGAAVEPPLRRGDLVFWKGHVGIMQTAETLLHANGFHMAVVTEPLEAARRRIEATGGGAITALRRM